MLPFRNRIISLFQLLENELPLASRRSALLLALKILVCTGSWSHPDSPSLCSCAVLFSVCVKEHASSL